MPAAIIRQCVKLGQSSSNNKDPSCIPERMPQGSSTRLAEIAEKWLQHLVRHFRFEMALLQVDPSKGARLCTGSFPGRSTRHDIIQVKLFKHRK
eukprot:2118801-Amphidinium_carterae.1